MEGVASTPRLKRLLVIGAIMGILVGYIGPVRGYLAQRSALVEERVELSRLEEERDALVRRLKDLEDPAVLEVVARERTFAREGERVFQITFPPEILSRSHEGRDR